MKPIALALALALLAGCAGPRPAPPVLSRQPAVVALHRSAQDDLAAGRTAAAAAALERALRIEPRNAAIWQELARVRLAEGRYEQAISLALRSNNYATNNSLRAQNWHIIERARSLSGDAAGAREASRRAGELE